MRNLKKFLALVMAMVMTFSLMLSVNAANTAKDFDDANQITEEFVEAADVLTGMKVFQGDEGGFRPGDTIIRAEVAALIYRLATGDVDDVRSGAYANYGNFTDVSESDWFAGYVGYCANAGYIKGTSPTTFDPYAPVTGYETLAMILRAIGYDKNNEFTGSTWETNVSALATQLGILTNIKTTHYGNTLYLASRRDVVAELLFQADAKVPMVVYTPAFGYQPYGMTNPSGGTGSLIGGGDKNTNPTLGEHIFGLEEKKDGILLGNQQTGESGSVLGYEGVAEKYVDGTDLTIKIPYSAYTWKMKVDASAGDGTYVKAATGTGANAKNTELGNNVKYELETGIDLIGHKLRLWYDNGNGVVSNSKKHVYAYFDEVKLTNVVEVKGATADGTVPTNATAVNETASNYANGGRNLYDLIEDAGFKAPTDKTKAVFNNSFGKFGTDFAAGNKELIGDGTKVAATDSDAIASPVRLYKLISNSSDKSLDAVIALNIESSRITESNTVNRVPTIGVPVSNAGTVDGGATAADIAVDAQLQTKFIDTDNVTAVNSVDTGVIAQAALVGNSTKTLGDYEFGIHITGTTIRDPKEAEKIAVKNTNTNASLTETAYFLMNKVTAPVEGTVVAYNVNKGTVTLDNGTVLERSKFYHTVVGWEYNQTNANTVPTSKIPQAWMYNGTKWVEGYANVGYKFYLDYEGKYLGAERTYGSTFLYGTYLDYDQKTSTSSFNYYLTGVNLDGEIETKQVSKYWDTTAAVNATDEAKNITGTDLLDVPFRDTYGNGGAAGTNSVNGVGEGVYTGFAITGDTVDAYTTDTGVNKNEYLNNMARLGVFVGNGNGVDTSTTIDKDSITLGAEAVGNTPGAGTNKYFTEATKFILVSGLGTDSVKAEVYNGISELKGASGSVILRLGDATTAKGGALYIPSITTGTDIDTMTYFKQSNYTYAQSGDTDKKIDVIILPKAAVTWTGGNSLYYVGDPTPSLVNSWGTDAWKYNLYNDGELQQVWLTNDPSDTAHSGATGGDATYNLVNDVFLNLKDTGKKANDGQPIYTAGNYAANGTWTAGTYLTNNDTGDLLPDGAKVTYLTGATYSAITRDAQTATFDATAKKLLNVASAKVVNLNAEANCFTKPDSGYIWPGITDLATLNQAGSIDPVTGRALKVAAVIDSNNPLVVTCIYVCYEQ